MTQTENLEERELSKGTVLNAVEKVVAQVERAEGRGEELQERLGDAPKAVVTHVQDLEQE